LHVAAQASAQGQRFPALAARLALRLLHEEDGKVLAAQVGSLVAPSQALGADPASFPPDFVASHGMIAAGLATALRPTVQQPAAQRKKPQCATSAARPRARQRARAEDPPGQFFDLAWFCGTLGRLHLNTMRTDGGLSVLYVLGSYFNHGCRPNVAPVFEGARVEWQAVRPIAAEDECLISYHGGRGGTHAATGLDANPGASDAPVSPKDRPESARDEFLFWNYGFKCSETCSCGRN
jgi:hypothetical protein